jgi:hypothetical protein
MPPLNRIPHHGPPLPIEELTPGQGWTKGWTAADHEALARLLTAADARRKERLASRHMVRDLVVFALVLLVLCAVYEIACDVLAYRDTVPTSYRVSPHPESRAL